MIAGGRRSSLINEGLDTLRSGAAMRAVVVP
jgi:hypothetical protein